MRPRAWDWDSTTTPGSSGSVSSRTKRPRPTGNTTYWPPCTAADITPDTSPPLFHTRKTIEALSYTREPPLWGIFHHLLADGSAFHDWRNYFHFRHSISIAPHRHVADITDVAHAYTCNSTGDIAFHSEPEPIEQRSQNFPAIAIAHAIDLLSATPIRLTTVNREIVAAMRAADERPAPGEEYSVWKRIDEPARGGQEPPGAHFRRLSRTLLSRYGVTTALIVAEW